LLLVHTSDGLTSKINLENEEQAKSWLNRLRNLEFREKISGLTVIQQNGVYLSLPRPQKFKNVILQAENIPRDGNGKIKGGERLICFADDVRLSVMVHRDPLATVRVHLVKFGHRRFDPLLERHKVR